MAIGEPHNFIGGSWNGAICPTCDARYVGSHMRCEPADLLAKAARLIALAQQAQQPRAVVPDRTASCPCRPENGGSGICGCVLNNQIVCG